MKSIIKYFKCITMYLKHFKYVVKYYYNILILLDYTFVLGDTHEKHEDEMAKKW